MNKIKIEHLDIPIIRSCNLACVGCITHSNHKNIKGIVRVEDSQEWLKFWADRLNPSAVTLFGGEPLLHPEFVDWVQAVRDIWGPEMSINFNTNGYYLDKLKPDIDKLFHPGVELSMVVSIQTGTEPYLSKVKENFELVKQQVVDYYRSLPTTKTVEWELWLDEYEINTKRWYRLLVNGCVTRIGFAICEQYRLHWCTHYTGFAEEMLPVYDYNDSWYEPNHGKCQASSYVTLYKGRMFKCPPIGVLEHTLTTFDIADSPAWAPYLQGYKTVGIDNTDEEIQAWFEQQAKPEQVCNMCGFMGPKGASITGDDRSHVLKNYWNYTL